MAEIYQPALKDDYYVENFHALAGFVADTYKDLLNQDELGWYNSISSAPAPAQRLYIRLLTRKRSVFRISRLDYPEIDDVESAADTLAQLKLASRHPPEQMHALLSCFTKPELLKLLELRAMGKFSRVALTTHISDSIPELQKQYQQRLGLADQWISLEGHRYWMLMQLCFFGNLYQDSSEFIVRQLGTLKYEKYPIEHSTRAFTSREQIEAHWRYFESESLFECIDQRNAQALMQLGFALPALDSEDINLVRRVDRLRNRIARQLERLSEYEQADTLYQLASHPPARERRARLMMRKEQWQQALTLLEDALQNPFNEAEHLTAQKLHIKCQKATGVSHAPHRIFKPASSKLVLSNQGGSVEKLAKRYYTARGLCEHTENTLINGMLGLFIWDIIFHPLKGVFFNPFQSAPADFAQPQFVQRRAKLLQARFKELNDRAKFTTRIQSAFLEHYAKVNPLVRWHGLSPELLTLAIERIPAVHWQAMFERILSDPKENSAGFPDLVLFPSKGGYEFIEIKGPGDTLQANQRRWMEFFDAHGIACRLVYVRYRCQQ